MTGIATRLLEEYVVLWLVLLFFMLLCLCLGLAGAVLLYAGFVQRGLPVPYVPAVGEWIGRAVARLKSMQQGI